MTFTGFRMDGSFSHFPTTRLRRLRHHPLVRDLVRETALATDDLILPLFVCTGKGVKKEIVSMPGNHQLSVDRLTDEVGSAVELGLRAFMFFGIPTHKDAAGMSALEDDGIVQQALRALRQAFGDKVLLITDRAVETDQGQKIVFVVNKDKKVETRKVTLGQKHGDLRVVSDGLQAGDRVIVEGVQSVRPGALVAPDLQPMPVSKAAGAAAKP